MLLLAGCRAVGACWGGARPCVWVLLLRSAGGTDRTVPVYDLAVRIVKGQYKVQADATGSWIRPCGSSINKYTGRRHWIVDQAQALGRG